MSDPPDEAGWFRAVEEEFLRRRGAPLLLSPRDWALMGEWRDAGIPLRLVIQAIGNVFDLFDRRGGGAGGRRINGLGYCRQEVRSLFEIYRTLHAVEAGRPAAPSRERPAKSADPVVRHLGRLARRLGQAMREASAAGRDTLVPRLARAAAEIKTLKRDLQGGVEVGVEAALARIDTGLLEDVRAALPPAEIVAIESEAETRLGNERARMSDVAWIGTRDALVARLLRRVAGIPRLTLFD